MADHIRIRRADGTWVIRAGGAVLGESRNALELSEGNREPVIYIPRENVAMAFLEPSATRTTSPHIGEASYFGIVAKSGLIPDAVWCYEVPNPGLERIAGHLAFDPQTVTVERL
jgi:uncharacterized protein (DUF427 family)